MYDRNHFLFTFGGTALSGTEIWQTGFRQAGNQDTTIDALVAAQAAISLSDCFADLSAVIGNTDSALAYSKFLALKWCKLAVIKPDGEYGAAPSIFEGNTVGKLANTADGPPQLAWAVTLGTGKRFGMAQKGRMYWPLPLSVMGQCNGVTGQLATTHVDPWRALVKTALEAVEGEISTVDVPSSLAVMSKSGGVSAPQAPGTTNWVTEIGVGRVIDTQRRRRSHLQEGTTFQPSTRLDGRVRGAP